MNLKPIQTEYKGYLFRSRLEARWAVFFDALGIKWEYEKEGYDLEGEWYLPDFWLPKEQKWVEIKDGALDPAIQRTDGGSCTETDDAIELADLLCVSTQNSVIVFWGPPQLEDDELGWVKNATLFCFMDVTDEMIAHFREEPEEYGGTDVIDKYERYKGTACEEHGIVSYYHLLGCHADYKHIAAARSARFEHGQKGRQL